jgi:alpha-L-fucosidase
MMSYVSAQPTDDGETEHLNLNKPERLEWFSELGFGMFIHFSYDSQLGVVISHSMVGASKEYLDRFLNELPKTFNPNQFNPTEIATIAKLAGIKYIVFTTKHHSGFCMWDTKTTDLNIMNTPYKKDLLTEYVDAVREAGLGVGLYYSPEDFNFLYENGEEVRRRFKEPLPASLLEKYLELCELQCTELMTEFGEIDIMFFDGGDGPLKEISKKVVWELQPNIVVTRGAIATPEQSLLGISSNDPWESCMTMGTQWQYKPTNEIYKSGTRLIEILIETRAKGGNLLLNLGPKPNGQIPEEQESNLMEMAAWNFINGEAIDKVRPWVLPNEGNIWFTWKPQEKTVYAFLTKMPDWIKGARKEFILKSVQTTENSVISVLGQSGNVVEYQPDLDASTKFEQKEDGLHVSCVRAQRIYNNNKWGNPIVLKITNAEPALTPPIIATKKTLKASAKDKLIFQGELSRKGDVKSLKVGFQYREYAGFGDELNSDKWKETEIIKITEEGTFKLEQDFEEKGKIYQFRVFAEHPRLRIYGDILKVRH